MMNKFLTLLFAFVTIAAFVSAYYPEDAPGDYQDITYYASFKPTTVEETVSITSYFSPDNSIQVETEAIENAKVSIDIGTPGFESWIGCTTKGEYPYDHDSEDYDDSSKDKEFGCTCDKQRNEETFPIFQALLNAVHRGVKVRILSNNGYTSNETFSYGYIDPISFLSLAGAEVRYFTTVTFLHSKYMMIDNSTASVSSINYSQTSFMNNREAGVLIAGSQTMTDFYYGVFQYDWDQSIEWPITDENYSSEDLEIIKDTSLLTVSIPSATSYPGSYVTKVTTTNEDMTVTALTSPDFSYEQIYADIEKSSSMKLYLYQITGDVWCDIVGNYTGSLEILVSNKIYDKSDFYLAEKCYKNLYENGATIRKTDKSSSAYVYSHQKIWILDDDTVYVSTGNWGPTDFPDGSSTFTPYKENPEKWRRVNRDFTIKMVNSDVASVYTTLFSEDYERGYDWYPSDTDN